MFHLAPPEVKGLGLITSTPGLIRSAQLLMCLGLPLRTANTTIESVTKPLYLSAFQSLATRPFFTSLFTSGWRERATTSAGRPASTARSWSPEAPYDWVKPTPLPAAVFWKAGMIFWYASWGVE